jgi:GntP family gluconate:H+ symporter
MILLLIGLGSVALLLLLIVRVKLHPFVALLLVSVLVALTAGVPPSDLAGVIESGAGSTLGHVALILPLGAMIGRLIQQSGGAEAVAAALVRTFGNARAPLALTIAGFLIGIPVFFEVGVVMLMPVAEGIARTTHRALLASALPMCVALLIVHALLPPHPGATAAVALLNADFARVLIVGLPVCALTAAVAYLLSAPVANQLAHKRLRAHEDVRAALRSGSDVMMAEDAPVATPGASTIAGLILFPIVLIMLGAAAQLFASPLGMAGRILTVTGIPFVALMLDVLLCAYVLGIRRGASLSAISEILGSAVPAVAMVILVTGAGGIYAKVLIASGIGSTIATLLHGSGLPILALAFLMTLLLRAAQGPATVAIIATAGIISPLVASAHFNPNQTAVICLSMGAGALSVSHVNDPGFWIVTRLTGVGVADGLRTWTLLTTCAGLAAFAILSVLWTVI